MQTCLWIFSLSLYVCTGDATDNANTTSGSESLRRGHTRRGDGYYSTTEASETEGEEDEDGEDEEEEEEEDDEDDDEMENQNDGSEQRNNGNFLSLYPPSMVIVNTPPLK